MFNELVHIREKKYLTRKMYFVFLKLGLMLREEFNCKKNTLLSYVRE